MFVKIKDKLCLEKNESKACVASAQRIADNSDVMLHKLTETRAKLIQITKQKETGERTLKNEITRLKLENEKLLDRVRSKSKFCINCLIFFTVLVRCTESFRTLFFLLSIIRTFSAPPYLNLGIYLPNKGWPRKPSETNKPAMHLLSVTWVHLRTHVMVPFAPFMNGTLKIKNDGWSLKLGGAFFHCLSF